jgi:SNF2 family DNA or RNA helicase
MPAGWTAQMLAQHDIANTGRNREVLAEAGASVRRVPRFPPAHVPSVAASEPAMPQASDDASVQATCAASGLAAQGSADGGSSDDKRAAPLATTLWRHQREAADFALARKAALLAVPMGGGKSAAAVAVACESDARTILVLCPVSVVGVWRREFQRHAPGAFDVRCLDGGTCKDKAITVREQVGIAKARRRRLVLVCNYESAWRPELAKALLGLVWDIGIWDEQHRIKSPSGRASRFVEKLARQCRRRLGLTGTPAPHSPLDLYAQFRALDPSVFGRSYVAFRARYALCDPKFPGRVLRWLNTDELRAKYQSLAYECSLDGVLDLPPVTEQTITVKLSAKARRAYDRLEAEFWTEVDKGEVTASNALTKLLRLAQITSGSIPLDDGTVARVDDAKKRALADFLEDVPPDVPVVVFCRFVADLDQVAEVAAATGRAYGEISGRRKDLTPHATMPEGIGLMAVQQAAGGVGIDLTRASVAVYLSLGYSLGEHLQTKARLHRPGQERHVTFLRIVAEDTVDEAVLTALERRQQVIEAVLGSRARKAA